jgi:hypothetical protein
VLLAAFHRHPTAGCFASFASPLAEDVEALGDRLPDPRAVEALRALGFGSVLIHDEDLPRRRASDLAARLQSLAVGDPTLTELGAAAGHRLYGFGGTTPARSDLDMLAAHAALMRPPQQLAGGVRTVALTFRNGGPATFRHPDPIAPTAVVVRWYDAAGAMVAEQRTRVLLPLALAIGDVLDRGLDLAVPATPGDYRLAMAPEDRPDLVIAVARAVVAPS